MAFTITINFNDDTLNSEIRNAFASAFDYPDTIGGQPNPESKAQFRDRMIKRYIKDVVRQQRQETARRATQEVGD